ncbi:putative beta-carotene-binding protein [Arctopsyche grandis]|uniref:putative beta-carotene-binding protein n=1 Tax=Arctopsyche grandis TaxID=121162 RepID=UPI00406D922D
MRVIPFLLIGACAIVQCVVIHDKLKICNRDDPELNDCIKDAMQFALKELASGLPELGIQSLDPHVEKEMKIEYKRNQITAKAFLKDITAHGLSNAIVHNVRANLQDDFMEIEADMSNKGIVVEGYFRGEGRLNAIVFNTKGFYNNTMSDLTWTWKISAEPEVKNGKTYMRVKKFFMRPEVGGMIVNLPVIFEDNPQLNKIAKDFAQNYWRLIYHELLPVIEQTWDKIGRKVCNKIFLKVPYDEIFPTSA